MISSFIEINGCKHYFLNEKGDCEIYFIHSNFFVEKDFSLSHPLGRVYKPKGCLDTQIRFVRQPDNSTLLFRVNEWDVKTNPFYSVKKISFFKEMLENLVIIKDKLTKNYSTADNSIKTEV